MNIDKSIEILEKKKKSLNLHIDSYYKNDCETAICRELVKERDAIENVLSDRETWKKIAEKLAEQVKRDTVFYDSKGISSCDLSEEKYCKCSKHNNGAYCKQCIIDCARKEVDNG